MLLLAAFAACGGEAEPGAQPQSSDVTSSTAVTTSAVVVTEPSPTAVVETTLPSTSAVEVTVPSSADDITVAVISIDAQDNPTRADRQVVSMTFQVSNQTDGSWGGILELGGGCTTPFVRTEASYPDTTVLDQMGLGLGDNMSIPAGASDLVVARPVSWPQSAQQCSDGTDVQVFVGLPSDWDDLTVGGDGQLLVDPESGTRYLAVGSLADLQRAAG